MLPQTWLVALPAAAEASGNASPFNLVAILGPEGRQSTANLAQNLAAGRARLLQVIVQKDQEG